MIRNFGATGLNQQPQGLDLGLGGSNIKSIQTGTTTFNTSSATQVISPIDINKSILLISYYSVFGDNNPAKELVRGQISSANQLTFNLGATPGGNILVSWTVIEFTNVKSLQRGTLAKTANTTEQTLTISAIDTTKCFIIAYMSMADSTATIYYMPLKYRIINSTSIGFQGSFTSAVTPINIDWQVIEFN